MHRAPKLLHDDGHLALAQPGMDDPGSKSRASGLENIVRHALGEDICDTTLRRLRASGVDGESSLKRRWAPGAVVPTRNVPGWSNRQDARL